MSFLLWYKYIPVEGHYLPKETTDGGPTPIDARACSFFKLITNRFHRRLCLVFFFMFQCFIRSNQIYINYTIKKPTTRSMWQKEEEFLTKPRNNTSSRQLTPVKTSPTLLTKIKINKKQKKLSSKIPKDTKHVKCKVDYGTLLSKYQPPDMQIWENMFRTFFSQIWSLFFQISLPYDDKQIFRIM